MNEDNSYVSTESILWIDGNQSKDWNGTMLKTTLHTWRENPSQVLVHDYIPIHQDNDLFGCPVVPSLHGMMMHKSFLCLLNHPIMSHLRNMTTTTTTTTEKSSSASANWNMTTISMALILLLYTRESHIQSIDYHDKLTPRLIPLGELLLPIMDYLGYPCFSDEHLSQRPNFSTC